MELLKNLEGLSADEQMTAVVELQKAAMKTLEEQKQASIGKSAELVIQGLKKIKSDFEAKFDSLNYDIQTKVASLKDGEQGLQGPKGDQGERGLDGSNGRDGRDGKNGKDGLDGVDGVGVRDAKIDFDGSLVISLTDGREINCGEVVSVDVAKQIQKVTHNIQTGAGGDSQTVLDAIAAIQATIATYGTMAEQNKTSVDIEGGTIDNTTIGATTPSTGVFTTLTATGQTDLGGPVSTPVFRVNASTPIQFLDVFGGTTGTTTLRSWSTNGSSSGLNLQTRGGLGFNFATNGGSASQLNVAHTASAVNYVQVTGAATGGTPTISMQGSDTNIGPNYISKGSGAHTFYQGTNGVAFQTRDGGSTYPYARGTSYGYGIFSVSGTTNGTVQLLASGTGNIVNTTSGGEQLRVSHTASAVNYVQVTGAATGGSPTISAQGSDSNTNLQFNAKGYGSVLFASGPSNRRMFEAVYGTGSDANWLRVAGAASSSSPILSAQGSDTNISQVFQSKGTGAIDLAAGSSGVNISNGGTVTAITRTANGTGYTSIPSVAITAPTIAGGVQATATATMFAITATVQAGGTGYAVGNVLTVVGGTYSSQATFTVSAVSAGVVTAVTLTSGGTAYSVLPTNPVSTTGGTGTGATLNITSWGVSTIPVGTAGSGYVEQPTVTFSGGGGSGAAAFAVVGSQSIIKGIGTSSGTISNQSVMFQTPSGNTLLLRDSNQATPDAHLMVQSTANGYALALAEGSNANASLYVGAKGAGSIRFNTQSTSLTEQMRVTNTTSAVNYVQVTGAATGNRPTISAQGSDSNMGLGFQSKGTFGFSFLNSSGGFLATITHSTTTSATNYVTLQASQSGTTSVGVAASGSDTNIDLTLTPKGTGNVRFGTYTGTALSIAGFIEIKDSGGTVRKLAVVA